MGNAIGQSLPIAIGILISPSAIVSVTLMLMTRRARSNALTFLLGWCATIFLLGAVLIMVAGTAVDEDGSSPAWVAWVKIGLGALSLFVAFKQWTGRPRGDRKPEVPGFMKAIDSFTPVKSLGLAVALVAINPKSLLIVISGAATIAAATQGTGDRLVAMAVFAVVGSLGVMAPPVIYLTTGARAAKALADLRAWLSANEHVVVAVLMLVIGVKLLGDGISGL